MISSVLTGTENITFEERPIPQPQPGEALVKVSYVGICGSDINKFCDKKSTPCHPVVIGHEFSGVIASPGRNAKLSSGQSVAVAPLLNCGVCDYCKAGRHSLCTQRKVFGSGVDGALQEYVAVPADRVFPLPPGLLPQEGALIEPLAVACHAVNRAIIDLRKGSALVLGAGAIGLMIAQAWRALTGEPVTVIDIDEKRLAIADRLDIPVCKTQPSQSSFDFIFEATGSAQALSTWLPALATEGRAIIIGKVNDQITVDWVALMRKEADFTTSRHFNLPDFEQALGLAGSGSVKFAPLIGGTVPFRELQEDNGKTVMAKARKVLRLLVKVSEE